MSIEALPATFQVPLISGRIRGPLGIGHLPRVWLKLRLHALGRLPDGYRHGDGGSDSVIIEALGLDRDAFVDYVEGEAPDYVTTEAWIRAHATTVSSPELDAITADFDVFPMPEPRRTDWTARFGLPDYSVATRLNELDDWDLVHGQIVAPDAPATPIVPAVSTTSAGPLGVAHLPRLWLKMLLHAHGRLPEGYRYGLGGFDEYVQTAIGIEYEPLAAFIARERPGYLALEAWVREHATNLTPAAIAASNAHVLGFDVPEERAAPRRAEYGVDASVTKAVALNDLDDWLALHHQLLASA
jgi:hypothetical protein